ncbi:hypothetical protein [Pedobacter sp. NJ-S-72]
MHHSTAHIMEENKIIKPYLCTYKDKEDIKFATDTLYVLSGKWRMYVIVAIYNGHHRYREIAKNIYLELLSLSLCFPENWNQWNLIN